MSACEYGGMGLKPAGLLFVEMRKQTGAHGLVVVVDPCNLVVGHNRSVEQTEVEGEEGQDFKFVEVAELRGLGRDGEDEVVAAYAVFSGAVHSGFV